MIQRSPPPQELGSRALGRTLGKRERQPEDSNRISGHRVSTLPQLRSSIGEARLHVRSNPPHPGLEEELEALLEVGVTSVMLPMVRNVEAARRVVAMIRGRAELIVMVEHADILPHVDTLASLDGVAALYVGVNDLGRSLGWPTRFSVLGSGLIETIARAAHRRGRGIGFFGIARAYDVGLLVPADLVFAEQVRLDVTHIVLARSFGATPENISAELDRVRSRLATWRSRPESERRTARAELVRACATAR